MRVLIVKPQSPAQVAGNDVTAERWTRLLREAGHQVAVAAAYDGQTCDVLVALHALKTAASALRFRERRPTAPLLVALTGTDVYGGFADADDDEALRVLTAADRLVELQPLARLELPERLRGKVRTILQSSEPVPEREPPRADRFEVCVIGHLRAVKDPFLTADASRRASAASRLHVLQVGAALDAELEARARAEQRFNPRYTWLGERSAKETGRLLSRCRLLVLSSRAEGGANVVSEAVVNDVPVLASRIPGSVGLLGENYPGYFTVGDAVALAELLSQAETVPAFLKKLRDCCRFLASNFDPAREREAWERLLGELGAQVRGDRSG